MNNIAIISYYKKYQYDQIPNKGCKTSVYKI